MSRNREPTEAKLWSLVSATFVLALLSLFVAIFWGSIQSPPVADFLFWLILSLLATIAVIPLPIGRGGGTSLAEIVDIAAFATVGPYPVLIANVLGLAGRRLMTVGIRPIKDLFNIAQWTLTTLVAYFVLRAFQGSSTPTFTPLLIIGALASWFVYSVMSTGLVSLAIGLAENRRPADVWIANNSSEFVVSLAAAPLALVMAVLFVEYGKVPVLLLVVPLVALNALVGAWMERTRLQHKADRDKHLTDMGRASAAVLHELSKPLSRILMTSDYAIDGGIDPMEALSKILLESREAANLSDKLFSVMKTQTKPSLIRVGEIVERFTKSSEEEAIPIALRGQSRDLEAQAAWDADLLLTAILNLIRNAWESQGSIGPPPIVSFSVSEHKLLRGGDTESVCRFLIRDSGPGFSEATESDIFEALYSTKQSGFGVGLFIVNQVAMAHGGKLSARNHPEGGAEFALEIPLRAG